MTTPPQGDTIREAVAVFDRPAHLEAAIDELESSGFDRSEISLLADENTVEAKLGHKYTRVSDLEDDPDAPRTAYVPTEDVGEGEGALIGGLLFVGAVAAAGAVVASGGALAAAITAAAIGGGGGGLIGGVLAGILGHRHARYLEEQLEKGGLLLWVRTWNNDEEAKAIAILSKHSGRDVHVHDIGGGGAS